MLYCKNPLAMKRGLWFEMRLDSLGMSAFTYRFETEAPLGRFLEKVREQYFFIDRNQFVIKNTTTTIMMLL